MWNLISCPGMGYSYRRSNPTISVKFEDPKTFGIVMNQNGATVGSLMGDGVQIKLSFEPFAQGISSLTSFDICLADRGRDLNARDIYTVPDFGLLENINTVRVLNVNLTNQTFSGHTFWCLKLDNLESKLMTKSKTVTLFPVIRMEDSSSQDIYSDQAKILSYVLCGFFFLLFALYSMLLLFNFTILNTQMGNLVPLFFLLLCAFRATFVLLWPLGELEDEEVVEYFLFETPTFLLFAVMLLLIYYWTKLQRRFEKTFFLDHYCKKSFTKLLDI